MFYFKVQRTFHWSRQGKPHFLDTIKAAPILSQTGVMRSPFSGLHFFCRSIMILDRDYRNPPHHRTLLPQTLSLGIQGKVVCSGMDNHTIAKFHFLLDWSCPASADALPHSVLARSGLSLPVSRSVTNVSVTPIWSCQCTVEGTV